MDNTTLNAEKVAMAVVNRNAHYYSEELLSVIPQELREEAVTDDSAVRLMQELDKIRFRREAELAKMLGLEGCGSSLLSRAINKPYPLPPDQERKRKEIKFLFNVAAMIIHG